MRTIWTALSELLTLTQKYYFWWRKEWIRITSNLWSWKSLKLESNKIQQYQLFQFNFINYHRNIVLTKYRIKNYQWIFWFNIGKNSFSFKKYFLGFILYAYPAFIVNIFLLYMYRLRLWIFDERIWNITEKISFNKTLEKTSHEWRFIAVKFVGYSWAHYGDDKVVWFFHFDV